jgi:hypothetical protein
VDSEIEINIGPRREALEAYGITQQDFEEALPKALDHYHDLIDGLGEEAEDFPSLDDARIEIEGRSFRLGDLADISISGSS